MNNPATSVTKRNRNRIAKARQAQAHGTCGLDQDALNVIQKALVIGLMCLGEIEERCNAQDLYRCATAPDDCGTCNVSGPMA